MLKFRQAILKIDGEQFELKPGKINSFEVFYVDFHEDIEYSNQQRWSLFLHPKQDIRVNSIAVEFHFPASAFREIATNGFHSGVPSRNWQLTEKMPAPEGIIKGDQAFTYIPSGSGIFHSWSHILFKGAASTALFGSANETTGFTVFTYDVQQEVLTVHKDLNNNGLSLGHSFPLLDWFYLSAKEKIILQRYCLLLEVASPAPVRQWLWSTAGCADLAAVENSLGQVLDSGLPVNGLLIDEGWATTTGDWVSSQKVLVGDLSLLAKNKGLSPTLLLSPFLASSDAKIVQQHPDWVVKNQKGQTVTVTRKNGTQAVVLDIYNAGLREYLSGFFHIAIEKWGISHFYFDDLYVASLSAPANKTRGQAMQDALDFLQQLIGNHSFTAGNAPIGAVLGKATAIGISSLNDIAEIRTAIAQQTWRGLGFTVLGRNPLLQNVKKKQAANWQFTQAILNVLLSDTVVIAGNPNELPPEISSEIQEIAFWHPAQITGIDWPQTGVLRISVKLDGEQRMITSNLTAKKATFWENQTSIELEPFETLTF